MPIRPENRAKYPKDWTLIRAYVLARAKNRCECHGECGLHHERRCIEVHGHYARYAVGHVVLTLAHLDHDETHNDYPFTNLKAMCQRCHNRYDQDHRKGNAARTRDKKKGQKRFEELEVPDGE